MRTDKAAFAASPVAHRVFDLLIRTAVRRLDERREPAHLERIDSATNVKPNRS